MAKGEEIASRSPHFFRIFLPSILQNGTLELPISFINKHGKSLYEHVVLKLSNGEKSSMKLKKDGNRIWLNNGWRDFVEKYSIKCGYFLVFRYKGGSRFNIQIFDLSTLEIEYPVSSSTDNKKNAVKRKLIEVEKKDCYEEDEILADSPSTAAKFHSSNPHFSVTMQSTYISKSYLQIPAAGRTYFQKAKNKNVYLKLNEADERTWGITYAIGTSPWLRVYFCSGWKQFSQDNHLQEGDVCVFEVVDSINMVFKVKIFRISNVTSVALPQGNRYESKTLEAAKAFKCNKPSFAVWMGKSRVQKKCWLDIPSAHGMKYLKDRCGNEAFLHRDQGEIWPFKFCVYGSRFRVWNGWRSFVVDNNLEEGDACLFELFSQAPNHYNVTIFRDAEL